MPVFTSSIEVTADYPTIKPSLNLNFARSRSLDPRITFTRASTATYVGRDGLIKTAGEDEARFDHDPETLESLGLLIEESRTNLITYSQDFTNVVWQSASNRATCDATTGIDDPSGGTTASRWSSGTSPSQELIYRQTGTTVGALTGLTCTKSIWVRRVSNDGVISFFLGDNSGVSINSQLNSVPVGTWIRCSVTRTIVGNNGDTRNYIAVYPGTDGQPTTIDIWGDQFEVGSFPTSYIPTSGAAVTRSADVANILGESFSNTFNTLEGTFIAECDRGNDGTEGAGIGAMRRPANSYFDMIQFGEFYDNSGMVGRVYVGGTSQAQIGATHTTGQGVYNRYSFAYKTDSFAGAINGVLQNEDISGSLPTGLDRFVFGGYADDRTINSLDGHIKSFSYYPKRLTNAQLQLLTS